MDLQWIKVFGLKNNHINDNIPVASKATLQSFDLKMIQRDQDMKTPDENFIINLLISGYTF